MRKLFCRIFNLISSYPMLAVILLAIAAQLFTGQDYRKLEEVERDRLEISVELKQKKQVLEQTLNNVEMIDLSKRYALFNQNFLSEDETAKSLLIQKISSALSAHGWNLQSSNYESCEDANLESGTEESVSVNIRANLLQIYAAADTSEDAQDEPFLPFYKLLEAKNYLWRLSPNKEYQRVKISRTETGYNMEATIFLPLADPSLLKKNTE